MLPHSLEDGIHGKEAPLVNDQSEQRKGKPSKMQVKLNSPTDCRQGYDGSRNKLSLLGEDCISGRGRPSP